MIILLSPSKKQAAVPAPNIVDPTQPFEIDKALFIMKKLKALSISEISKIMKLSEPLAKNTYQDIKNFSLDSENNKLLAINLFQGDAFQKLDAASLSKVDLLFAQDNLIILSALYGYLKPLDIVQPYRLDMNNALIISENKNLYQYWQEAITDGLNRLLLKQKNNIILNLASSEYFKAIDLKKLLGKVIHVEFKVYKDNKYKTIGIYAKRGRGLLTRYIIDKKIDSLEKLIDFNGGGFKYSESLSKKDNYVFVLH